MQLLSLLTSDKYTIKKYFSIAEDFSIMRPIL